jgi:hypothetical protein
MTNLPIELARHYREEADRVRKLAADAMLPGVRDALLSVVRQYDDLAESVGNSGDYSLSVIRAQIQFGAIQTCRSLRVGRFRAGKRARRWMPDHHAQLAPVNAD